MTTTAERDYLSIGQLAAHVQRSVRKIEQAATALHIEPAMKLNGVPYFDGRQVEQLTEQLNSTTRKETVQ
jgi:hypothetical protein